MSRGVTIRPPGRRANREIAGEREAAERAHRRAHQRVIHIGCVGVAVGETCDGSDQPAPSIQNPTPISQHSRSLDEAEVEHLRDANEFVHAAFRGVEDAEGKHVPAVDRCVTHAFQFAILCGLQKLLKANDQALLVLMACFSRSWLSSTTLAVMASSCSGQIETVRKSQKFRRC